MNRQTVRVASMMLAIFGLGSFVLADDNRPLFVEITELDAGQFRVGLRVPPMVPVFNQPILVLPPEFEEQPVARLPSPSTSRLDAGIVYRFFSSEMQLSGRILEVRYPLAPPAVATVVRVSFADGRSHTVVLAPGESHWPVPAMQTRTSVAADYLRLGIHHIWAGTDHLLFLVCLIFIAGNVRRILATITGFTLAHSLTLALSALDLVRLPVPPIEAVIALSVVFLAAEVCKGRRSSLTWRYPMAISSGFGLLHGLGFAAVLMEIGLPETELVTGLLFFNLGVEVGQIAFASIVIFAIAMVARMVESRPGSTGLERRLQWVVGYGAGCCASFWLFERTSSFFTQ